MKLPSRTWLAIAVLIGLVLLLEVLLLSSYQRLTESADRQRRNIAALQSASGLLRSVLNMETGLRGFLLTGAEPFLEPHTQGDTEFREELLHARSLTADGSLNAQTLEQVAQLEQSWRQNFAQPLIERRRAAGTSQGEIMAVLKVTQTGVGKAYTDQIRVLLRDAQQQASARLEQERQRIESSYQRTAVLLVAGGGGVLLVVVGLVAGLIRNLQAITGAKVRLEKEVEQRRRVEAVLRTSEQRLGLALEAAGLTLFDLDTDTGRVYLSERWAAIMGEPALSALRPGRRVGHAPARRRWPRPEHQQGPHRAHGRKHRLRDQGRPRDDVLRRLAACSAPAARGRGEPRLCRLTSWRCGAAGTASAKRPVVRWFSAQVRLRGQVVRWKRHAPFVAHGADHHSGKHDSLRSLRGRSHDRFQNADVVEQLFAREAVGAASE
jgi:CHASE3 domain sensor protein